MLLIIVGLALLVALPDLIMDFKAVQHGTPRPSYSGSFETILFFTVLVLIAGGLAFVILTLTHKGSQRKLESTTERAETDCTSSATMVIRGR